MTRILLRSMLALVLCSAAACEDSKPKTEKPAPPKINLPDSPSDMTVKRTSDRFADGSYSVAGLIRRRGKLFGEFVEVKGFVKQVHRCADGDVCDTPSHAILVDDMQRPRRRLVVVGDDKSDFPALRQGQARLVRGLYRQTDPRGVFVRMEGIVVMSPRAPEVPAPEDPAPSAPSEVEPKPADSGSTGTDSK